MPKSKLLLGNWLLALLHVVGFILLWYVIRDLEWHTFYVLLTTIPFWKYLAGLGVLSLVYIFKSLRWHLLNRTFGIETTWGMALIFYLSAGFLSVITPGRLGELSKIYFLNRKYKVDIPSATSSVFLDRIWDVLALSSAVGISMVILLSDPGINLLILIAVVFLLSLTVILLPSVFFIPLLFMIRKFTGVHQRIQNIFELWKESRFKNFVASITITILSFVMLAAIPVMFSYDTTYPIPFQSSIAAISISSILSFFPVTIAGFGTRELVFTEVWRLEAYPKEIALSISTAYFMITYLGSLLMGGVVYLINLKHLYRPSELRKLTSGESVEAP